MHDLAAAIQIYTGRRKNKKGTNPMATTQLALGKMQEQILRSETKNHSLFHALTGTAVSIPIIFLSMTVALGLLDPLYNPLIQTISMLVYGPFGWLQTSAFYLFGIFLMALSFRIFFTFQKDAALGTGVILVGLIGMAFIVIGIYPTQAPDAAWSIGAGIHEMTAKILPVLFTLANFCIRHGLRNHAEYNKVRIATLIAGIISLILTILGIWMINADSPYIGLLEWVLLTNGLVWLQLINVEFLFNRRTIREKATLWTGKTILNGRAM